ncbi:hypothetical protein [Nocardiopsis sp. NRRL B-16309]|uniref:hypothetical protein n=1 Tax=Nocardiopsis sp. NRRL B-16309 TaxID=1519494 RepID=UPI0006ADDB1E|nr:hypothetical protein [Nocardiopsis sp. NRRL B-16309]KOX14241.1 hypothetical protein ADL05_16720 [Nocardiopsis sp. NRRL B-16309]
MASVETGEVVSGIFDDDLAGRRFVLVERIPEDVVSDRERLRTAVSEARREHSGEDLPVLLRRDNGATPPGEWKPHTTYLVLDGTPGHEPPHGITIGERRPKGGGADHARGWLLQALRANYGDGLDPAAASRWVDTLFAQDSTSSFIAFSRDEPVGHLTVEYGVPDACSERPTTEIVDVLIDLTDRTAKAAVERALVAAAARAAAERNEPIIGNVVHRPEAPEDPTHKIVSVLESRGWSIAYRIWQSGERQ